MLPERRHALTLTLACVTFWCCAAFGARWLGQWIALGGIAVVLALGSLVVDRAANLRLFRSLWPDTPREALVGLCAGIVGGVVMTFATYALYEPVVRAAPFFFHDVGHLYGVFVALPTWAATLILVPIIACEELVWRGVVQSTIAYRLSPAAAAALTCVVYALAHAPAGSPVLALAAFGCGLVWCALRGLTRGLVAPLVAHLVWDFSVLLLHPLAAPVVKL